MANKFSKTLVRDPGRRLLRDRRGMVHTLIQYTPHLTYKEYTVCGQATYPDFRRDVADGTWSIPVSVDRPITGPVTCLRCLVP